MSTHATVGIIRIFASLTFWLILTLDNTRIPGLARCEVGLIRPTVYLGRSIPQALPDIMTARSGAEEYRILCSGAKSWFLFLTDGQPEVSVSSYQDIDCLTKKLYSRMKL